MTSCLLLTSTISPDTRIALAVSRPDVRLAQYRAALARWLEAKAFDAIVYCDSSNASREAVCGGLRLDPGRFEFLSFVGDGERMQSRGKGYGEMEIIRYALAESKLLRRASHVAKCTGRLNVPNIKQILRDERLRDGYDVLADLSLSLNVSDSRFFIASPQFIISRFLTLQPLADDTQGVYFEHLLARAVLATLSHGGRWLLPKVRPVFSGQSGSTGVVYRRELTRDALFLLKKRLMRH